MGKRDTGSLETKGEGNTGNTESTSARTATGGRGGTGGRGTEGKPTEKSPKLVMVDVPNEEATKEDKPKRKNKPGAGRPAGSKKNSKKASKTDTQQLKILMLTISGIVASREGMEVWNITPEEADQIIEPLANVMSRYNVGQATSEYADHIALVVSLFIVFVPKYLIWKQTRPKKTKKEKHANESKRVVESRTTTRSGTGHDGGNAVNGTQFGGQLYGIIPPIG